MCIIFNNERNIVQKKIFIPCLQFIFPKRKIGIKNISLSFQVISKNTAYKSRVVARKIITRCSIVSSLLHRLAFLPTCITMHTEIQYIYIYLTTKLSHHFTDIHALYIKLYLKKKTRIFDINAIQIYISNIYYFILQFNILLIKMQLLQFFEINYLYIFLILRKKGSNT